MPPVAVSLTIPEAEVARVRAAAEGLTGLTTREGFTPTAKELLAALVKLNVTQWERQTNTIVPPGVV